MEWLLLNPFLASLLSFFFDFPLFSLTKVSPSLELRAFIVMGKFLLEYFSDTFEPPIFLCFQGFYRFIIISLNITIIINITIVTYYYYYYFYYYHYYYYYYLHYYCFCY